MNYKITVEKKVPNADGGFKIESEFQGYFTATILTNLVQLFAKPNMIVAEIGVWEGNSFQLYIDMVKKLNGHVYLIDWWKGSKKVEEGKEMSFSEDIYEEAHNKVIQIIEHYDAHDYVTILKGDTVEMSKHIPDGSLDICFIDADHTFDGCKRDIKAYLPKVKKGGIMSGDDMDHISCFYDYLTKFNTYKEEDLNKDNIEGSGHPGVHRAVWECFGANVNTYEDGWYTFAGYEIARGAIGVTVLNDKMATQNQSEDIKIEVTPFDTGIQLLGAKHLCLIPQGWKNENPLHQEASLPIINLNKIHGN